MCLHLRLKCMARYNQQYMQCAMKCFCLSTYKSRVHRNDSVLAFRKTNVANSPVYQKGKLFIIIHQDSHI